MGVTQLWQVLAPVERHQTLASLEGLTLAVDLSIWVCETQCVKQMQGVVSKPFLRNLFFRISHLTQLGVKLVFVIEGSAPELKWEVMMQRQQARYPGRQGKQPSQRPVSKQTRRNFNSCLKECCELLDILGIPYVQSRGEAEAMCALLNEAGLVDGCLTNDGDAFLYGARTVYRNFTMNTKDPHVEMYSMVDIEHQLEVDRQGLVALGLLLGCDFVPRGVPGIGVANATKLLQSLRGMDVLKRFQEWRKMPESQCVNQAEVLARRKAIGTPDFPQLKVVQEFMTAKDRCPTSISPWRRPVLGKFQDFALVKLEWPTEYSLEKVLPLVTLWDMQDVIGSSNPSTHQHLKPHRIVKTRVRQGVPCYEVEWYKPVTDTYDGEYYVTVESQDLYSRCYPDVVGLFEMAENSKKKKKGQGKKKKKNSEKSRESISDALDNLSFNLDKMNIAAVTQKMQQSVKSLPQSLPQHQTQQSLLMTKIKAQKHYSAGHAIAPGSSSGTEEHTTSPPVTVKTTEPVRPSSTSSVSVSSPAVVKKMTNLSAVKTNANDSDEENLLPFLERVKMRMKAKQSQSSTHSETKPVTEKTTNESYGKKSGKKKNKKKKGAQPDIRSEDSSKTGSKNSTPRVNSPAFNSRKAKNGDKSAANDLSDMNSLLEDIENLSLLRDDVLRNDSPAGKPGSVSEVDKLKQRLSFSATSLMQKPVASPVTPFGTTRSVTSDFRKMSSPHFEGVCSPMSYIQNLQTGLSDSFEIRDSPGNSEGPAMSKKKAKKARQAAAKRAAAAEAAALNDTPAAKPASQTPKNSTKASNKKLQTPGDHKSNLKNKSHVQNSPANLSEIDTTAVKDFGDFKIQHSLLNSLCASLVQAITPKGISKEEYDKLCAALNKLDDKEEDSHAAHTWIESEIDKSLKQVGMTTAEAVSKGIHSSFIKAASSPADNLKNTPMQAMPILNSVAGMDVESEEYKNLSKSARKKLRRKERQKIVDMLDIGPETAGVYVQAPTSIHAPKSVHAQKSVHAPKPKPMDTSIQVNYKNKGGNSSANKTKIPQANVQKKKPDLNGSAACNRTNSCNDKAREKPSSTPGISAAHLGSLDSSKNGKTSTISGLNKVSDGLTIQKENRTFQMKTENLVFADVDAEEAPKKKKKKKKKKVKKADSITNLSADDSMMSDLQSKLCSEYLRKAVENLKSSNLGGVKKIEKASPVMDLSADETVLELEDLSSHLSGIGPSLDAKTRLKLARKRSSLEKQSQEGSQSQQEDNGNSTKQDMQNPCLEIVEAEPILSLNKVVCDESKGENKENPFSFLHNENVEENTCAEVDAVHSDENVPIGESNILDNGAKDIIDKVTSSDPRETGITDPDTCSSSTSSLNESFEFIWNKDAETEPHSEINEDLKDNQNLEQVKINENDGTHQEIDIHTSIVEDKNGSSFDDLRDLDDINGAKTDNGGNTEQPIVHIALTSLDEDLLSNSRQGPENLESNTSGGINTNKSVEKPTEDENIIILSDDDDKEEIELNGHEKSREEEVNDKHEDIDENLESNISDGINTNISVEKPTEDDNVIIVLSDDDSKEEIELNGHEKSSDEEVEDKREDVDDIYIHIQLKNGINETPTSLGENTNGSSYENEVPEKGINGVVNSKLDKVLDVIMCGTNGAENGECEDNEMSDIVNGHADQINKPSAFIVEGGDSGILLPITKDKHLDKGLTNSGKSEDQSFITNVRNGLDHNEEKCCD